MCEECVGEGGRGKKDVENGVHVRAVLVEAARCVYWERVVG